MTINLPPSVENSLRNAILSGQFASMDEAITEAASLLLERLRSRTAGRDGEETAFEALQRAGFIGCLESAIDSPTDLSTNPNHMNGFGSA